MKPYILILLFFFIGCKSYSSREDSQIVAGKQFFEFDQILYFSTNVTEIKAEELLTKGNLTTYEKYYSEIISGNYPESLKQIDTNKLLEVSFKKKNLDSTTFSTFRKVFATKVPSNKFTMLCMPVYRDILVFINKKKITGIAKICFGCHQYQFLGQKVNTETFGSNSDYEKVRQTLN